MNTTHLAIDLGAESGRAVLGTYDGETLTISEVHRWATGVLEIAGRSHWNIHQLSDDVYNAINQAGKVIHEPLTTIGISTWGVDYALYNEKGALSALPYSYRDKRTANILLKFSHQTDLRRIYDISGVQLLPFNTFFQLFAEKEENFEKLSETTDLLFIPDIINYRLTGKKTTEFTFATTSQLYNPVKKCWDDELFNMLGINKSIMQDVLSPCTIIGRLLPKHSVNPNLSNTLVVAPAAHDTASAIAAIPASGNNWAYISSGTWMLAGVESGNPIINELTYKYNITNEGGIEGYRQLKNLMGLWLLQGCRKVWGENVYTYDKMLQMANEAQAFPYFIDPDDCSFFNPESMPEAIISYCKKSGQQPPGNEANMVRGIIENLALKTRLIFEQITEATSASIEKIYITGGGTKNSLLCQFIANACNMPVITALTESTAAGNIIGQMIACGSINNLADGREIIRKSCNMSTYYPQDIQQWENAYGQFRKIIEYECEKHYTNH